MLDEFYNFAQSMKCGKLKKEQVLITLYLTNWSLIWHLKNSTKKIVKSCLFVFYFNCNVLSGSGKKHTKKFNTKKLLKNYHFREVTT